MLRRAGPGAARCLASGVEANGGVRTADGGPGRPRADDASPGPDSVANAGEDLEMRCRDSESCGLRRPMRLNPNGLGRSGQRMGGGWRGLDAPPAGPIESRPLPEP